MSSSASHSKDGPSLLERCLVVLLLLSVVGLTFILQFFSTHIKQTRKRNKTVRARLFHRLGLTTLGDGSKKRRTILGFFHPYCNAGGGGERVLFQAVEHQLRQDSNLVIVIFSGDVHPWQSLETTEKQLNGEWPKYTLSDGAASATKDEILEKCNARFGIPLHSPDLAQRIHFLPLSNRIMVSDTYWKRLTLLGQAYGSMRMAFEANSQIQPDVWIDSMGYAFAYPIFRFFSHKTPMGAYVHYPMISTDMLKRVIERKAGHTNSSNVSSSRWRSKAKIVYYRAFAWAYARALRSADVLVANGSWTRDHLNSLTLGSSAKSADARFVQIVYPPCDTASLTTFDLEGRDKHLLVSLAQFRPEKEHATQIRVIRKLLDGRQKAGHDGGNVKLICMGSSRNEGDERRIEGLKKLAKELDVLQHVDFVINAPYATILENLGHASIGLSTMVDEHFGINVVEFMAAGLVTLSHASAGPLLDIAVPVDGKRTGFHANTIAEFAERIEEILRLPKEEEIAIRSRARLRAVDTFGNEAFCQSWDRHLWQRLKGEDERKAQ